MPLLEVVPPLVMPLLEVVPPLPVPLLDVELPCPELLPLDVLPPLLELLPLLVPELELPPELLALLPAPLLEGEASSPPPPSLSTCDRLAVFGGTAVMVTPQGPPRGSFDPPQP